MYKVYVFVDVSGKQEFIFKSSKLKDNLLNSYLVKSITEYDNSKYFDERELSLNSFMKVYGASKVYCGGGNSIISFDSEKKATDFIKDYSKRVLQQYPDLELYLSKLKKDANKPFDKDDLDELIKKANLLKEKKRGRYDKISFGIEKIDKETGFPMEFKKKENQIKKIVDKARENLNSILDLSTESKVIITSELQDYKSEGDMSYMGIISIDGNGMGDLMEGITDIKAKSKIGNEIRKIYFDAVSDYLKELDSYMDKDVKTYVTPIVSAGDDLCLIMHGKIAIDAAANILKNIKNKSLQNEEIRKRTNHQGLTACAGVAIVKSGYPFFDAYKEAEKMCKGAKMYLHKIKDEKYFSIIDWKIVQGSNIGANDFLENIKIKDEKYHIKPLIVDEGKSYYSSNKNTYVFSYHDFKAVTKEIEEKIKKKEISQSTLRKLQESFYIGFEGYKLDIEVRRSEYTEELFDIISEYFKGENIKNDFGVIETPIKEKIYVLNDIIDSLKFMTTMGEN